MVVVTCSITKGRTPFLFSAIVVRDNPFIG